MKRKVFEEFVSHPSKSRRLDGELLQAAMEESRRMGNEVVGQQQQLTTPTESERALVLYDPANTPFLRSPSSPDFNFILNSDLVPGLKDLISWPGNSDTVKPSDDTNDCLALVPWIGSQFPPQGSPTESPVLPEPMDSEEVEMMDTKDSTTQGLQFWQQQQQQQQHCLLPQFLNNTFTHVTW